MHSLLPCHDMLVLTCLLLWGISLRFMTSQLKNIVTHTGEYNAVKCIVFGVWVQNFVWNLKGTLWNFAQNFELIHFKISYIASLSDTCRHKLGHLLFRKCYKDTGKLPLNHLVSLYSNSVTQHIWHLANRVYWYDHAHINGILQDI